LLATAIPYCPCAICHCQLFTDTNTTEDSPWVLSSNEQVNARILMRVSAGLSRLSVSITSGGAVATAVAAGSAIDALSTAAISVVSTGCVAHSCGSCQPECD
jgi:hypothetical protein